MKMCITSFDVNAVDWSLHSLVPHALSYVPVFERASQLVIVQLLYQIQSSYCARTNFDVDIAEVFQWYGVGNIFKAAKVF